MLAHEGSEERVVFELVRHGDRVSVEVQEAAAPLDRCRQVPEVLELQARADVSRERRERNRRRPERQLHRSAIGRAIDLLDPRDRSEAEKVEQRAGVERGPEGEPQRDRSGRRARRRKVFASGREGPCGGTRPQLGRRHREDGSERVVELADAREPGRERDVRKRKLRGLDEHARGLRTLGASQGDWSGPDLGNQLTVQVTLAVVELAGQTGDAVPIDDAVSDQPHRATDEIGTLVPLRRSGGRVRAAALARSEPGELRGGSRREEPHVGALGEPGGTARPAIDPGARDRTEEPAVEPWITALDGPVAPLLIFEHARSVTVHGATA